MSKTEHQCGIWKISNYNSKTTIKITTKHQIQKARLIKKGETRKKILYVYKAEN